MDRSQIERKRLFGCRKQRACVATPFRRYLAHFSPVFPRFLRVFTVSTRRFQRAASRIPGPRNSRQGTKRGELPPSFDTPGAVGRITWGSVVA